MKSFKEFVNEAKAQEGSYYVLELPNNSNSLQLKLVSGPHKTRKEAEKSGGDSYYGWNQDKSIAILSNGKLMTVNDSTGKATDKSVSQMVGKSNIEQHLGLK